MAKNKPNPRANRPIRFDQFKRQIEDLGIENFQRLDFPGGDHITFRLANGYNCPDQNEFEDRLEDAGADEEELCRVILSYDPEGRTADEQWEICERNGCSADDLAVIFANTSREQAETMGKLKLRRS